MKSCNCGLLGCRLYGCHFEQQERQKMRDEFTKQEIEQPKALPCPIVQQPLTEQDVRRIVREEIAKVSA